MQKAIEVKKHWYVSQAKELRTYFESVIFQPMVNIFKEQGVYLPKSTQRNSLIDDDEIYRDIHFRLLSFLSNALGNIEDSYTLPSLGNEQECMDTIKVVTKKSQKLINLPFNIDNQKWEKIAKGYIENTSAYAQKYASMRLNNIKKQITKGFSEGKGTNWLTHTIKKTYGIDQRKANMLARQQFNLLSTEVQKTVYQDNGIDQFKWVHSATPPARRNKYHKQLYGKVFLYVNPPIIDLSTGDRGFPGQRWGCKCAMMPVVN